MCGGGHAHVEPGTNLCTGREGRRSVMKFPTMTEVEQASREQLAYWYRFLPGGVTLEQKPVMDRLFERFKKLGGFDAELSKKIGLYPPE